jgi:replication factor C subunit 2/4
MYIPWIEKYKPLSFEDFEDYSIKTFNIDNFNNMILYGNSGTGKTSFLNVLKKKVNINKKYILTLNASDERGIQTVREKIKNFSKQVFSGKKLIILDEADNLTYDAQSALRRIIEIYSKNTRFCFICNYISKIIEPIKSRCNLFHFKKYSKPFIYKQLSGIIQKEDISEKYSSIIDDIIRMSDSDIRKSIIYLEIFTKIPYDILCNINLKTMAGEIDEIQFNKIMEENDFDKIITFLKNYSYNEIQNILFKTVLYGDHESKEELILLLSNFDKYKNNKMDIDIFLLKFFSVFKIEII